ncbi:MAG: dienelactone hydrolase family protein [Nocardioidaceae bacterium]
MSERLDVPVPDGLLPARLWVPEAGSGPGIVLLQEIFGVTRNIVRRAQDLAALGYVVAAPELFWRLDRTEVDETEPAALETAMGLVGRLDWEQTVADAVATLQVLRADDRVRGRVGVLGFCFGGGLAFNVAAVADPDVLVSYYGSALPDLLDLAPRVTAPSLHHFGTADSFLDAATVARVRAGVTGTGSTVAFETYDGADHAFDNADFALHHPEASARAWRRTVAFLAEHLPVVV